MKLVFLSVVVFSCSAVPLPGQPVTNSFQFSGLNLAIPDTEGANFAGVQDSREISMDYNSIENIRVTLNIVGSGSGAFNGDFYAYLTKGDNIAILLNRPGRTSQNPAGYGDNGLNVTFDDDASNGDIHVYRLTLSGNHNVPLEAGMQLSGNWAPDGRHMNPQQTLDTDARLNLLDIFSGVDPNGEWTLFVADMDPGGTAILDSWGMEISAVPEPQTMAMLIFGSIFITVFQYKRKGRLN